MTDEVNPIDPEYEAERGRVALWLDAEVARLLAGALSAANATLRPA